MVKCLARISIHALLAESDRAGKDPQDLIAKISIHALLAESDRPATRPAPNLSNFYPRSPCGERHNTGSRGCHRLDFYPRSPCGERRKPRRLKSRRCVFLSTLSLRRATLRVVDGSKSSIISIHALLAESDRRRCTPPRSDTDFYPRSPCGERPLSQLPLCQGMVISIHALLAESDLPRPEICRSSHISIHALLAESDRLQKREPDAIRGISIHALLAESDLHGCYSLRHSA